MKPLSANLRWHFLAGIALALGLAAATSSHLFAAAATSAKPKLEQHKVVLGTINNSVQVVQTNQGPRNFVNRNVDEIGSESVNGCRIAFATTNDPQSPKLHVVVDGQIVPGYEDVAWHSLKFSPDGKHVAFVANKNSKQVCVLDGKPGSEFDRIGRMGTDFGDALVFSPDGQHLGYAAQRNGKWLVVVDGVQGPEFADVNGMGLTYHRKITINGIPQLRQDTFGSSSCPVFTPDGQHIFYLTSIRQEKNELYTMIFDGKPGPEFDRFFGADISPDGHHVIYAGSRANSTQVIYDSIPEPPIDGIGQITFNSDGTHHGYVTGGDGSGTHSVVIDGKPGPIFNHIDGFQFGPDGQHFVYGTISQYGNQMAVILDGVAVPPIEGFDVHSVIFSLDGKSTAYVAQKNWGKEKVVVDGVSGPVLPGLIQAGPVFSPDGKHFAYIVRDETKRPYGQYAVVDGVPGPQFDLNENIIGDSLSFGLKYSPNSRHLAYKAQQKGKVQVVVDNTPGPEFSSIEKDYPIFSPDGEHYAYAGKKGELWQVVVNGKSGPDLYNLDLDGGT